MHDDADGAERRPCAQRGDQRGQRLLAQVRVLGGAVDQVDGVDEERLDAGSGDRLLVRGDLLVVVDGRLPLPRALVEDLDRPAAALDAASDRVGRPAGGGDMGADQHGRARLAVVGRARRAEPVLPRGVHRRLRRLDFEIVEQPEHGTLEPDPFAGQVYTPDAGYRGPDTFTVAAKDHVGEESDPIVVKVTVLAPNRAPTCVTPVTVKVAARRAPLDPRTTCSDPDGDAMSGELIALTAHGHVEPNAASTIDFVPDSGYTGTDRIVYRVRERRRRDVERRDGRSRDRRPAGTAQRSRARCHRPDASTGARGAGSSERCAVSAG